MKDNKKYRTLEVSIVFSQGKAKIHTLAIDNNIFRISNRRRLSAGKFKNKKLMYYWVKSDNNTFELSFNPNTFIWNIESHKITKPKK